MPFQVKAGRPVAQELARVVGKALKKAVENLGNGRGVGRAEAVHGARKCLKKTRAALRLLEPKGGRDHGALDDRLRRIAHQLSSLRDVDVTSNTIDALRDRYPHLVTRAAVRALQRGLLGRKQGIAGRVRSERLLLRVAREIERSRAPVRRCIRRVTQSADIRAGTRRGYRRARKAMAHVRSHPDAALFHKWRRRVKDHWYQMRLLEGLDARTHLRIRRLKQSETWLGDDHDLDVLRTTILDTPRRIGDMRTTAMVLGCIAQYQTTLRQRALKRGRQLFASTPSAFRTQIDR